MTTPIERLLNKLEGKVKETAKGWETRCPAHDDRKPSLSIAVAESGDVLIKCHAGCETEDVVEALGLKMSDLFVQRERTNGRPASRIIATYRYTDEAGNALYEVCRFDPKGFRQRRPDGKGGWIWNVQGVRRVPYRLLDLVAADPNAWVFVVEGEKDVERLRAAGLIAACNAGGAGKWGAIDNSVFRGRRVAIIPDNDNAGRHHAHDVARRLHGIAPEVRIVELPGLPHKGDVSDWLRAHSVDDLRATVEAAPPFDPTAASDATQENPEETGVVSPVASVARYKPFPTNLLPEPLRSLIVEGARVFGVDPAYFALPALANVAAAIGTSRCIELRPTWREYAILWMLLIARSGTLKSAPHDLCNKPLQKINRRLMKEYKDALKIYEQEKAEYEAEVSRRKRKQSAEPLPEKPEPPPAMRFVVSDVTVEALAAILEENPRGVLLSRDELRGWVESFNQYKGGRGSDAAFWLAAHRGGSHTVDRKTGDKKAIYIDVVAISVCGTIQPKVFLRIFTQEHFWSGLVARICAAWPPSKPKKWTERDIPARVMERYEALIEALSELSPATDEDGNPIPVLMHTTPAARKAWATFYDAHAQRQAEAGDDDLAAAFAKQEAHAARFALILALVEAAAANRLQNAVIEARHIEAGAALAEWFCDEAERLYAMLARTDGDRLADDLIEFIRARGGSISVREVQQRGPRAFRASAEVVRAQLDRLKRRGLGNWETIAPGEKGGRPGEIFRLAIPLDEPSECAPCDTCDSDTTPEKPGENEGSVDAAHDGNPETSGSVADPADDEWGEV